MKNIIITILSLFVLSCGGDDNDSTPEINFLSGSWFGSFIDSEDPSSSADQTLLLNNDGTGSVYNDWGDETFQSDLTWTSTSSTISITTLVDNSSNTADYVLSDGYEVLQITTAEGQVIVYIRM
jgi:hypothetical protein|tara:strand:- start:39 stop:410 length:372 start_codon:yes stop_codon:yes gene_type:complete